MSEPAAGRVLRIDGLDCVVLPALAEMLAAASHKRLAWHTLRLLRHD